MNIEATRKRRKIHLHPERDKRQLHPDHIAVYTMMKSLCPHFSRWVSVPSRPRLQLSSVSREVVFYQTIKKNGDNYYRMVVRVLINVKWTS